MSQLGHIFIVEARALRTPDAPTQSFEVAATRAHAARRAFTAQHPELFVVRVARKGA